MIKTFTEHDLLQYIYDELPAQDQQHLAINLLTDASFWQDYEDQEMVKNELNSLSYSPSQTTLDKILRYSANFEQETV